MSKFVLELSGGEIAGNKFCDNLSSPFNDLADGYFPGNRGVKITPKSFKIFVDSFTKSHGKNYTIHDK